MLAENGMLHKDPSKCDLADGMSPNSTGSYIPVDGDQNGMNSTVNGDRMVSFLCFTSQVNSYGHGGTVSSPNHTFSWASLNKRNFNQYFVHILLLVTDNNPY